MKIKIVNQSKHALPEYATKASAGLQLQILALSLV